MHCVQLDTYILAQHPFFEELASPVFSVELGTEQYHSLYRNCQYWGVLFFPCLWPTTFC